MFYLSFIEVYKDKKKVFKKIEKKPQENKIVSYFL